MKIQATSYGWLLSTLACVLLVVYGITVLVGNGDAAVGINKTINFQGKVTNPDGTNVTDGSYAFDFAIYTVPSAGAAVWTETTTLTVTDGIFQHNLGSVTALPGSVDFNSDNIYLGITFNNDAAGEMTPRIRFTSSPYAFNADMLDGLDASALVQLSPASAQTGSVNITGGVTAGGLTVDTSTLAVDSVNNLVGIGLVSPATALHIRQADPILTIQDTDTGVATAQSLLRFAESDAGGLVENYWQVGASAANASFNFAIGSNSSGNVFTANRTNGNVSFGTSPSISRFAISGGQTASAWGLLGTQFRVADATFTDSSTAASGTAANAVINSFGQATLAATNAGVSTTNAATVYIQGPPIAGTNQAITNPYALWVDDGNVRFDGMLNVAGQLTVGTADTTGTLLVLDTKTDAADPTGSNGGMYYNSNAGRFRCYEGGVWKNCISSSATINVRSFLDTTADALVDANTTDYWDTAAENNNSFPNFTPSASSGVSVMGILSFEITSTGNGDTDASARIERGIGSVPTCGSGTVVGGNPGNFATNTGAIKSSTVTFVDTVNTTSIVYYTLCSDAATVGTTANVSRIRFTLQEVVNSNL